MIMQLSLLKLIIRLKNMKYRGSKIDLDQQLKVKKKLFWLQNDMSWTYFSFPKSAPRTPSVVPVVNDYAALVNKINN